MCDVLCGGVGDVVWDGVREAACVPGDQGDLGHQQDLPLKD